LYNAQALGAQYAWQSPRLKGNRRANTVNSWFCAENKQMSNIVRAKVMIQNNHRKQRVSNILI